MLIKGRRIDPNEHPVVIAEIGINHAGCLETAKQMVMSAYKSGCEIIKHQTHFPEDEMTCEAKNIFPPNDRRSIWEVIASSALSKDDEIELKNFTEKLGMIYISTPFSRAAADFLESINVPAFKIGSGECNNIPLINHIASFGKPIIMSTGMQSIGNISQAVDIFENKGIDYALLECTNLYPSPPEYVSLQGVNELSAAFPNAIIGFSDHSIGPYMALSSVALGASIIERHFTDSRYRKGPDITASMDPSELRLIIERSKEIFIARNNPKGRSKPEEDVYAFARSSVVADKDLKEGTIINESDIWARRPGSGEISVDDFYNVIGKKLKVSVCKNQQLRWNYFE